MGIMAQFTALAANQTNKAMAQDQLILLQEAAIKYSKLVKENPANHAALYNLAVISYRLQKYTDAEKYFTRLLKVKAYHLLAKYNLALVANKQQKRQRSIDWFLEISSYSNTPSKADKKIIRLAEIQLKKLLADGLIVKKKKPGENQLKTYLLAKIGHDDRVEDPTGNNIYLGDNFLKFYALLTFKLDKVYPGFETRASLYDKSFDTFEAFDYQLLTVDAGQRFKQGKWKHLIRLGYSQSSFGATDYLSGIYLNLKTRYKLQKQHTLSAELRIDDHQSEDTLYDDYTGSQQRLRLQYQWRQKPYKFRAKLEFEDNNRADNIDNAGVLQTSYSPQREKLQLTWFYDVNKSWKGYLRFEHRDSRYKDFSANNGRVRDEQRQQYTLQVKYRINKGWWWLNQLQYTDNGSNIVEYDYNRTLFSTGISGYF